MPVGCSSARRRPQRWCRLIKALKAFGADDIIVFAGGVIPAQDYDTLYAAGAKAIFGPGTPIIPAARIKQIARAAWRRNRQGRRSEAPKPGSESGHERERLSGLFAHLPS